MLRPFEGDYSLAQYPVRRNPKILIGAVVTIAVIIVAFYGFVTWWKPRFVVYTYSSFMDWGDEGADAVLERAFRPFEEMHGIDIDFIFLEGDANFIVSRLNAEAANPVADVVIGIDAITSLRKWMIHRSVKYGLDKVLATMSALILFKRSVPKID